MNTTLPAAQNLSVFDRVFYRVRDREVEEGFGWAFRCFVAGAAMYGVSVYLTLPVGVAVLNDDFGYLRSVIETLQHGRPWTNDWLEPWAASLSVLAAILFKVTGSFLLATQGLQALAAGATVAGAAALLRNRGCSVRTSVVGGVLVASMPTLLWKQIEFTGMIVVVPALLWALWAAERRRWGLFFAVWVVAVASRQSAATWLVLPAVAAVMAFRCGEAWRKAAIVVAAGVAWVGLLAATMNTTHAQTSVTGHWLERLAGGSTVGVLAWGAAVAVAAGGIGRWVAVVGGDRSTEAVVSARWVWGGLGGLAVIAVSLASGGVRLFSEHGSFEGTMGLLYATGGAMLAVAGWLLGAGRVRGEVLLTVLAGLALIATRREVWDYYYAETALLMLFAIRGTAVEATRAPAIKLGWLPVAVAGCIIAHGWFWWEMKGRVDRDAAAVRIAEAARRSGAIDVLDLRALPMSFAGWHLHRHFVTHEGRGDSDIGGFMRYLRSGALEVRWSGRRFWRDSRTLRPVEGADAARVAASEVVRIGWFGWQRCTLLRRSDGVVPPSLRLARESFRAELFPLNNGEWRALIEAGWRREAETLSVERRELKSGRGTE